MKNKVAIPFWQIVNMNVGFFGIQYSFGLQQSAINPIFNFLGASYEDLPILNLAGPVTGLLVQPIIGAVSDKTWHPKWGRRRPFFLIGALLGSLCLFAFPFSSSLWFAVGLLWILDAANNIAMEPYRAFVGDCLPEKQQTLGYLMQSLFVGAGITVANFSLFIYQSLGINSSDQSLLCDSSDISSIPVWVYYTFFTGAFFSLIAMLWSVFKTREYPPENHELKEIEAFKKKTVFEVSKEICSDIYGAVKQMPLSLKRLGVVYLFQWYALFIYWQFITPLFKQIIHGLTESDENQLYEWKKKCYEGGFLSEENLIQAQLIQNKVELSIADTGLMNGTYNLFTMLLALFLVPVAARIGSRLTYSLALIVTAFCFLSLPFFGNIELFVIDNSFFDTSFSIRGYMILAIGIGLGWACIMGIPYAMVSGQLPTSKRGIYMGIINMMIVIPMLIETLSFGKIFKYLLNNNPSNALLFAGLLMMIASIFVLRIPIQKN
jgi:maltose/moltooligosaccharide transporter